VAVLRGPGVKHMGDVWMIQQGEGLLFGFKPSNNLFGVHPRLDYFERHLASDRSLLLSQIDYSETTLTENAEKLIRAYLRA
jgi:hypothetical protein